MADTDNDGKPRSDGSGDASGSERRSRATPEVAPGAAGEESPTLANKPATEAGPPQEDNPRPAPDAGHQAASEEGPAPVREEKPERAANERAANERAAKETPEPVPGEQPEPSPDEEPAPEEEPGPDEEPGPARNGEAGPAADGSGETAPGAPSSPDKQDEARRSREGEPPNAERQPSAKEPSPKDPSPKDPSPKDPSPMGPSATDPPPKGPSAKTPPAKPKRPRPAGGGILMGRPFGVPVYVAPSWFLVAALITWVFGGQLDRVLPELGAARYLIALFFAVAFYASVLVHELAHTVAALRFKLPVRRIQLQFFGGVSEIEKESETPGREFILAFVGPLLSLALAGVFFAGMRAVEPGTVPGVLLAGLTVSNLIVAVFNLLPGLPLDGGRMLRAVVWKITGKPMAGTVAAAWVGRALAIAVLIGLPLATQAGGIARGRVSGMDSLTDALLAAILAAIIWTGAGNSLRMARLRERLPELRARNLTRRAVPVETETPLSEALRRANEAGARALVVVDGIGEPLSLVREAAIAGVPEHRRPWVAVSTLAQDLKEGMRVPAELAGEDLLEFLRATPATEYLVVEETGEIYGVLSAADVERAFVAAMAKPSA
ncbi:site-2 protease family protein [Streptomyces sp. NBC_01187]|uniref:site-2 protease family protein n=1 Tax=Streptomyces sp. NBC_01187 TaxID=2903766 RepID=UPI0038631F75|nr:site-2 protease family protein [Streptomyces sp. NBC_01187]